MQPTATPARRRPRSLLGRLLLLASTAVATASAQEVVVRPSLPDGRARVTVPLEGEGGAVVLPISINGAEPLPILLDSGMPTPGIVLFDGPHIAPLDLAYTSMRARIGGAGGGASHEARIALGATFRIGEARLSDSRLIVLPPIPGFDVEYAEIIGLELLSAFAVSVDYDSREVTLTLPSAFEAPAGAARVPLSISGNLPYVEARLPRSGGDAETLRLVLDLGAHHAVSLDASHPTVPIPEHAIERQLGRGLSGAIRGHLGRVPALVLGGHRLESVLASFPASEDGVRQNAGRDGNLGVDVLRRFHFTLDYAGQALYLQPNRRFGEAFEADMSGLRLESDERAALRVAEVSANSPAARAGIAVGDRVLAVDGGQVTATDRARVLSRLRRAGLVSLKVARGKEEPRTVELVLRRLI